MAIHLCLIILIVVIVVVLTDASSLGRISSSKSIDLNNNVPYADENIPREDLIKMVRSKILRELNLSEDVLDNGSNVKPVPKITDNEIRLLMSNGEKDQLRRIVVRPLSNDDFSCLDNNEQNCRRFEFEITSQWSSIESIRVWFRKKQPIAHLSIIVFFDGVPKVQYYEEGDFDVIVEYGLTGFNVMKPSVDMINETTHCIIETKGAVVHETDEDRPFMVLTQNQKHANRNRRSSKSINKPSTDCNCCVVDRNVSAAELMLDKLIIYPPYINIKACRGRCKMDQSTFNDWYGRSMYNMAKFNSSFNEYMDEFWVPRCYPSKMRSIGMFYVNSTRIQSNQTEIVEDNMDIVIDSCTCMTSNCYSPRK
ncbi:hypothetical protein JTE90_022387 [Oedothorax gibbosus]|uniref:TGF-beta family profile domain-containing protein n=1 Tax=Oedothorax gibbosus TaxID=931172 RepID=A0AAV6UPD2_9ARAC|nr:hypothetical protein JTE90_022387 [Oedothorax gibbosus]